MRPRLSTSSPDSIAAELAQASISIAAGFVAPDLVEALASEARRSWEEAEFRAARIGAGANLQLAPHVRSDHVLWWGDDLTAAQRELQRVFEELRLAINRTTFLGLFEWEGHYACYPPGARYQRHLDVFANARERQISMVLYLNEAWQPAHGGQLRIWTTPAGPHWELDSPTIEVEPRGGTLVTFLSEDIYHEVLPSRAERFSVTGWFRTRLVTG